MIKNIQYSVNLLRSGAVLHKLPFLSVNPHVCQLHVCTREGAKLSLASAKWRTVEAGRGPAALQRLCSHWSRLT